MVINYLFWLSITSFTFQFLLIHLLKNILVIFLGNKNVLEILQPFTILVLLNFKRKLAKRAEASPELSHAFLFRKRFGTMFEIPFAPQSLP